MKILLMCHFPLTGSGSGVYTLNIAHALAKLGHEVRIIVPENQPVEDYGAFGVHPVYFNGCTAEALDFNFPCFTTHPRSTQTFYDLSERELASYETAFRAAIEDEIRAFAPDIIHCGHAWLQPSYAADYDIPLVVTVHGTDLIGYEKIMAERDSSALFFQEAAERSLQEAAAIVTISQENNALVRRLFPDQAHKCHLILNGYNSDVFYPDNAKPTDVLAEHGIAGDFDHIVSFAGKFAHFKGIDVLLRAVACLQATHPEHAHDTAFVLAGDGELFDEMNELAAELGVTNVHFVHNQPHDALRRLYSVADVSLLTSRKEPFGLVIIEAMACGAPVIGSDDGGAVDIITPDVGLLFQSENPTDLAEKMARVLAGGIAFDRATVAAYAKRRFSQDESIHHLVDLYEDAVG